MHLGGFPLGYCECCCSDRRRDSQCFWMDTHKDTVGESVSMLLPATHAGLVHKEICRSSRRPSNWGGPSPKSVTWTFRAPQCGPGRACSHWLQLECTDQSPARTTGWPRVIGRPGCISQGTCRMLREACRLKSSPCTRSADDSLCLGQLPRLSVLECLHSDTKGCLDNSTGENQSGI